MLHILFVILKILGIILACILGLLLLLVLVVLVVPLRYRLEAKKKEEFLIKFRVHWLARIVIVQVWFIDNKLHVKLRLFGFTIWDNLNPRPKKDKKPKKSKVKKSKKKLSKRKKSSPNNVKAKKNQESVLNLKLEDKQDQLKEQSTLGDKLEAQTSREQVSSEQSLKGEDTSKILKDSQLETTHEDSSSEDENEKKSFFSKIGQFFGKIKAFFQKIPVLIESIKKKIVHIVEFFKKVTTKRISITDFLKDEVNNAGIKIAFGQLFQVLRHCGPQKLMGHVVFGTGDPASTGQALAIAAIFYGRYGANFTVVPDFENKIFEAEVTAKGRIRILSLLIIGIRVIRDKDFKQLIISAKKLKEEL